MTRRPSENLYIVIAIIPSAMESTTRTLIVFTIVVLSVGVVVSSGLVDKIITMVVKSEAGDAFIYINDIGTPASRITVNLTDEDGDGYGDSGEITVENRADFTLNARITDVQIAVSYETGEETGFVENRTGHGIWEFYEDSDSDRQLSPGDVMVGKLKIKQSSSSLDEDAFKVASENSKDLRITMEYQPYAPGRLAGATNYTVSFKIYVVEERYGRG